MLKRETFLSYQLQISNLSKVSANWVPDYKTLLPSEDDKWNYWQLSSNLVIISCLSYQHVYETNEIELSLKNLLNTNKFTIM
jgi:hypothetical protein